MLSAKEIEQEVSRGVVKFERDLIAMGINHPDMLRFQTTSQGTRTYNQSRDYYNATARDWNEKVAKFAASCPFVFEKPNSFEYAIDQVGQNILASSVRPAAISAHYFVEFGGVMLGVLSGLVQRFCGGTGYTLQKELASVIGGLFTAVAVDLPAIIYDIHEKDGMTLRDIANFRKTLRGHFCDVIQPLAKRVLDAERGP